MKELLILIFVGVLAACGGSGGSTTASDTQQNSWDTMHWDNGKWQ